jgi:hypothetical protein
MASYNEDPIDRALSYWDDTDAWTQYKRAKELKPSLKRMNTLPGI